MVPLFKEQLLQHLGKVNGPLPLPDVSLETLCEMDHMVGKILAAYQNQSEQAILYSMHCERCLLVHININTIHLTEDVQHRSDRTEADPTLPLTELTEPTLIMDWSGNVLVWYLPGALSGPNQVSPTSALTIWVSIHSQKLMWDNLELLREPLLSSLHGSGLQSWRTDHKFFRKDVALKGAINLFPGWFQQGRHVCASPTSARLIADCHFRAAVPTPKPPLY
jgi:hypothetical protein